jgi:tetratricopeptide (TPR) repeat protein
MGSPRALASLVASVLVLVPAITGAQPAKPSDTNLKKAGELVRAAISKSQAGDHSGAIELYLNAYLIVPNAALLSNIGSEYQQSNKPVEALKYFCKYLDAEPTGANAPYANAQAKTLQIQLNGSVDEKNVCKPVIKPPPPVDKTDLKLPVEIGGGTGSAGTIYAPCTNAQGPIPGCETDHGSEPAGGGGALKIAGLATAGVGAIVLGLGIKYGLDAQAHTDFVNSYTTKFPGQPWPADIKAYEQEGHDLNTKQVIFTIGGSVAVVTGVVIYFVGRSKASSSSERAALRPTATPTSLGVALSGGF